MAEATDVDHTAISQLPARHWQNRLQKLESEIADSPVRKFVDDFRRKKSTKVRGRIHVSLSYKVNPPALQIQVMREEVVAKADIFAVIGTDLPSRPDSQARFARSIPQRTG